ncbi:regulator of chromosome condensation domain-containing protein [Tieghemostelium lacteum]|uniref:Regulator of chromosome condensation domain-containing protein n=1 Tax=Tieghemostelium lacteum TaxID=361077 RepID=A0A151ZB59_TIELA|nr:regulator of chromosome condensation domain-containing protein [Tieghemostelium lacteum]|eukprot:KYQ91171.1 regulator of chromosome condensation domain-containing protein [Tieghemostelium lacteum]
MTKKDQNPSVELSVVINQLKLELVKNQNVDYLTIKLIKCLVNIKKIDEAESECFNYLNTKNLSNEKIKLLYVKILVIKGKLEDAIDFLEKELSKGINDKMISILSHCFMEQSKKVYTEENKQNFTATIRGRVDSYAHQVGNLTNYVNGAGPTDFIHDNVNLLCATKARILFTQKNKPREVMTIPRDQKIIEFKYQVKEVACGLRFFMVLDVQGRVFTWGDESSCNIGYPVTALKFKHISAGFEHCAAISQDNQLYTWGRGSFGKLGLGTSNGDSEYKTPTLVVALCRDSVKKVSCFGMNTSIITDDGKLFVCGRNHRGQLGIENAQYPETNPISVKKGAKRAKPTIFTSASVLKQDILSLFNQVKFSNLHLHFKGQTLHLHTVILACNDTLNDFFEKEIVQQKSSILNFELNDFLINVHFLTRSGIFKISESKIHIDEIYPSLTDEDVSQFFRSFYSNEPLVTPNNVVKTLFTIFNLEVDHQVSEYHFKSHFNSNNKQSDFKIKTQDGKVIHCHKSIMSVRSPYFKNLLNSNFKETTNGEISVDLPCHVALPLYRYMYTDRFSLPVECTGDDLLSLLDATNLYEVKRLHNAMEKLISVSLDLDNAIPLMKYAHDRNANQLVDYIADFIATNKDMYGNQQDIQNLPKELYNKVQSCSDFVVVSVVGGQYTPIHVLQGIKFFDIAQGEKLTLALDENNLVHQLGRGSSINFKDNTPARVVVLPKSSQIASISAGSSHCIVVTEEGKFYGWGAGFLGQLGDKRTFLLENQLN